VVRFRPDFPRAHLNYGVALAKQGKLEPALKEFQFTLQLNPTNASARRYLEAAQAHLQMLRRRAQ
jgi:tetratricopeptide (TPR) repeat protein